MNGNNKKSRILVGLWDCPYCGAKGLNGLKKQCPNCGHPQDEGTKFYLGEEKQYLSEEEAADYGKGADWTCAYCGALNRYNATVCSGCGADREESTGDYFDNEKKQAEKEKRRQAEINAAAPKTEPAPNTEPEPAPKKKRSLLLFVLLAALIAGLLFVFLPRKSSASVSAMEWTRVYYTQNYEDVQRSDWSLPADATLISSSQQVHHYDPVFDHYEDVEVERTREVIDHYDTESYTVNNGDGTFTEHYRQVPVYATQHYTETEKQPVYIQVPVMGTKYVYVHKEWVQAEPVVATGTDGSPYWPDFTETETSRISSKASSYSVALTTDKNKTYSLYVPETVFTGCKIGDKVELTVTAGSVTAINGVSIG